MRTEITVPIDSEDRTDTKLTVAEVANDASIKAAARLFRDHTVRNCRGRDTVATRSIILLSHGEEPVAAGEIRWNEAGIAGLNRLAVVSGEDLLGVQQAAIAHAHRHRPAWQPISGLEDPRRDSVAVPHRTPISPARSVAA